MGHKTLEGPAGSRARLACALALSVAFDQSENRKIVVAQSALRDFRDLHLLANQSASISGG